MVSCVVFGDWHADTDFALQSLEFRKESGTNTFVHVGDFGFCRFPYLPLAHDSDKMIHFIEHVRSLQSLKEKQDAWHNSGILYGFVHDVNTWLREHDTTLYVIPGNHENYWEMADSFGYAGFYRPETKDNPTDNLHLYGDALAVGDDKNTGVSRLYDDKGFVVSELYSHIKLVPRTHVWQWDGRTMAAVGGANSIDKHRRLIGRSWWPDEELTAKQVDSLEGVSVDILFSHDGDAHALKTLYSDNRKDNGNDPLLPYHKKSSYMVRRAIDYVQPRWVLCGHHHQRRHIVTEELWGTVTHDFLCDNTRSKTLEENSVIL